MHSLARRFALSLLLGATCFFTGAAARANPLFPGMLKQNVPMPCLQGMGCTLCHNTDAGGPGNIKPHSMGQSWIIYGLDGTKPDSLVPALNNAKEAMQDTDGDGVPDVIELSLGDDPNTAGTPAAPGPQWCSAGQGGGSSGPMYGCFRVAPPAPVDNVGVVAGAVVALVGLSALRRRRR